jgi:hypothetical protein
MSIKAGFDKIKKYITHNHKDFSLIKMYINLNMTAPSSSDGEDYVYKINKNFNCDNGSDSGSRCVRCDTHSKVSYSVYYEEVRVNKQLIDDLNNSINEYIKLKVSLK